MSTKMKLSAASATSKEQLRKSHIRRWVEICLGLCVAALLAIGGAACAVDAVEDDTTAPENEAAVTDEETGEAASALTATAANLKVAFIGDTHTGTNFKNVLKVVKNEGASALFVQGDMAYAGSSAATWWSNVEEILGSSFPVFIVQGNHDVGMWSNYLPKAANHLGGATRTAGDHNAQYKTVFKGLAAATIKKGDSAADIDDLLGSDTHLWKLCLWHQNQKEMQIGGKTSEMGWEVYSKCRQLGAIVVTAHEHSYERTKTLSSMSNQTVDSSCSSRSSLCVGPGRTFVVVSGLGGEDVRDQTRCLPTSYPHGCKNEWGFIYASQQGAKDGAMFITFNVDGNPKKAKGYFKNVNGGTVDNFTVTHD